MISHPNPKCPQCSQADQTYKVSLLYLEASTRLNQHEKENQPELDGLLHDLYPDGSSAADHNLVLRQVVQAFAPPSGTAQVTRRVHPDMMVFFFSLVALMLLYQIATNQPENLTLAVIIMSVVLLVYVLLRKPILSRFSMQHNQEQEENRQVVRATDRWMRLYFCSRDQGIFQPGQNKLVPLEQMSDYLREQ